MKYIDTWDLESIFPGGTKSKEVQEKLASVEKEIKEYEKKLQAWEYTGDEASVEGLKDLLAKQETVGKGLGQRSEEHTSELQSRGHLVCRLLLEKKKMWNCTPN